LAFVECLLKFALTNWKQYLINEGRRPDFLFFSNAYVIFVGALNHKITSPVGNGIQQLMYRLRVGLRCWLIDIADVCNGHRCIDIEWIDSLNDDD
jgi:hypothetical protein